MTHSFFSRWMPAATLLAALVVTTLAVAQPAAAQKANGGNAANGKKLFTDVGCAICHGDHGEGNTAPQISPPPLQLKQFTAYVRTPTGTMTPLGKDVISDAQLVDVYAYLVALSKAPASTSPASSKVPAKDNAPSADAAKPAASVQEGSGSSDNGKRLFTADGCYECHGCDAQGGSAGPSLAGPPPLPLPGFVGYVRRPTGQMPPFTEKVLSDQELADIYAFLKSLPAPTPGKDIPLLNH